MAKRKGIAFILVVALSITILIALSAMFFTLKANINNLKVVKERSIAYYLCETGASVAIRKIQINPNSIPNFACRNRVCSGSETFTFPVVGNNYNITYQATRTQEHGQYLWEIISKVGPPQFSQIYKLRVTARRRAFPIFIKGFPGK